MSRAVWLPVLLVLALLVVVSQAAEQGPSKLSKLIPSFDGDGDHGGARKVRRTAFQRPVNRTQPPARIVNSPDESALSKFNKGTKRLYQKTKQAVLPDSWIKERPKQAKSGFLPSPRKTRSTAAKPSRWKSLFAREEPKPKPSTVPDWLSHPKP